MPEVSKDTLKVALRVLKTSSRKKNWVLDNKPPDDEKQLTQLRATVNEEDAALDELEEILK